MFESFDWSLLYKIGGPFVGAFSLLTGAYWRQNSKIDKVAKEKVDKDVFEEVTDSIKEKVEDVKENLKERMSDLKDSVNTRIDDQHESIKLLIKAQTDSIITEIKSNGK